MNKAEALERIEKLEARLGELEDVSAIEAHCASIVVTWVDYPSGRVGLDAAGSMVRVEMDPSPHGWAVV
jgi:hypothetical protein